jgi:hypothetical protein
MDVQATRPNTGKNPFRYQGPAMPLPYAERSDKFFERRFPAYRQVLSRLFKDPDAGLGRFTPYDAFFNLYKQKWGKDAMAFGSSPYFIDVQAAHEKIRSEILD